MTKNWKRGARLGRVLGAAALVALAASAARAEGDTTAVKKSEAPRKAESAAKFEPVSSDPQLTTASFGDWVERCQRIGTGSLRLCEVAETVQVEGQNAPLAQVAIGRAEREGPMRLTLVLPVNVALHEAPKIKLGAGNIDLAWKRCVPAGCIADAALSEADLSSLRAASEPGQVEFKTAAGQDLKFPASARGLAQSLDALRREPIAMTETKPKP